jgi:hypothetical protein
MNTRYVLKHSRTLRLNDFPEGLFYIYCGTHRHQSYYLDKEGVLHLILSPIKPYGPCLLMTVEWTTA